MNDWKAPVRSVLGLLLCLLCFPGQAVAAERPNILLILVDDMGFNDLGINNPGDVSYTPRLDQLAGEGVRFTRHYTDVACSPSRAMLLTGRYAARLGYRNTPRGISPDIPTLPKSLQASGYRTHFVGKWLTWGQHNAQPHLQGFDSWFGFLSTFQLGGEQERLFRHGAASYFDPWLQTENGRRQYRGHLTDLLAENVRERIAEFGRSETPWFINYWTYAPHLPMEPSEAILRTQPATPEGRYHALLLQLDNAIAGVLDALRASGQDKNTLVVVVSDNGGTNLQTDNNAPFGGSKLQFGEGGSRTPLLMRWPGRYSAGQVVDAVTLLTDLFPTLARVAAADASGALDGRDLGPLVAGEQAVPRFLFWEKYSYGRYDFAALSSDAHWRLMTPRPGTGSLKRLMAESRAGRALELYDVERDPGHGEDRLQRHPELVDSLRREYLQWHKEVRQLDLAVQTVEDGYVLLSGDDYQRVPGFGGYTLAFALPAGAVGERVLAEQPGLWNLEQLPDGQVGLEFDGRRLQGRNDGGAACHSVVLSAYFYNMSSKKQQSEIVLYLDGVEVDRINFVQKVPLEFRATYTAPTRVIAGSRPPLVFNTHVTDQTPLTAAMLNRDICEPD